jgi:PIN domain nuclease of toxin-antitoxin system
VNLLLDTHALLWSVSAPGRLSALARDVLSDRANRVVVSSASAWEIAIKHRLGRFPEAAILLDRFHDHLRTARIENLPISLDHALAAGALSGPHKDPFDRMLIAQARLEDLAIVTADPVFRAYEARIVW